MSGAMSSDLEARVPATTEMEGAAAGGGDTAVTTARAAPTCPVCMEPWACNGDHRICCIPCGHVYGRSCLERWLHRSGNETAKCPQCGEQFEQNLIINLYAPGNLWDGCCRFQEFKAHCQHLVRMIVEEKARSESSLAELRNELRAEALKHTAEIHKKREEFEEICSAETESFRADLVKTLEQMVGPWIEEVSTANTDLTTMKERMKKMSEEGNATAAELVEFMELNLPQMSLISNPFASNPFSAPAPVDYENNERQRRNRTDQPVPEVPGPAGAASKRRGRGT